MASPEAPVGWVMLLSLCIACSAAFPLHSQGISLHEVHRLRGSEFVLDPIVVATVGPNGQIWASQPRDGAIVGLLPGETRVRWIGRRGEGPGDLQGVAQIYQRGDSIWLVDLGLRRVTKDRTDGRVISTVTLRPPAGMVGAFLQASTPNGVSWWRGRVEGATQLTVMVAQPDGAGAKRVELDEATECYVSMAMPNGGSLSRLIPYCHTSMHAYSSNGMFRVSAYPKSGYGATAEVAVSVRSLDGGMHLSRTVSVPAALIPSTVRDSAIRRLFEGVSPRQQELAQEMVRHQLVPEIWSPLVSVAVSDHGDVLLVVRDGSHTDVKGILLRRGESRMRTLPFDSTQRLRWFGGSHVLLVSDDPDGVEDAVLYRMTPD